MRPTMDGGKPKKAAVVPPARRTGETPAKKKITVSQATIDQIKAQGMTAALKKAAAGGASASYVEGVKRMYGVARLAKATSANINAASKPKAYGANNAPAYRPGTAGQVKFNASKAASASAQGKGPKSSMAAGRTSSTSAPKDTRSNATKLFDLLGGKNGTNPKSKEKAAYLEAERKRVAAARKREAAARAARNK